MPKSDPHYELTPLPVAEIDVSHLNVRKSKVTEGIDELAQNIKEIGLQQPIVVFKKGQRYEVIIGQRRLLAYRKLGRKEIPAS
jgi:ParB family chromosome partitioning protein